MNANKNDVTLIFLMEGGHAWTQAIKKHVTQTHSVKQKQNNKKSRSSLLATAARVRVPLPWQPLWMLQKSPLEAQKHECIRKMGDDGGESRGVAGWTERLLPRRVTRKTCSANQTPGSQAYLYF